LCCLKIDPFGKKRLTQYIGTVFMPCIEYTDSLAKEGILISLAKLSLIQEPVAPVSINAFASTSSSPDWGLPMMGNKRLIFTGIMMDRH
jgi:hypothetical protein